MHELPDDLLKAPFSLSAAAARDIPPHLLRPHRVAIPVRGVRVGHDVDLDLATQCRAAALVLSPQAAFSHTTALQLQGLPMPLGCSDELLHVSVPRGIAVPDRVGMVGHDALWDNDDVIERAGIAMTHPFRTLCDLGTARWSEIDLLCVADAILREDETGELGADLLDRVLRWAGRRGAPRLRSVLDLTEPRVDSPMETRLRFLLVRAGLPRPMVNITLFDESGAYLHRPDLSWPQFKVAVDYDGAHHFVAGDDLGERRRRIDVERQERMQDAGWLIRVMTKTDVLKAPNQAVHRVRSAMIERGYRG